MLPALLILSFALAQATDALWCGTAVPQTRGLRSRGLSNSSTSVFWPQITVDTYFHVVVGYPPKPEDVVTEDELNHQFNILNNDYAPYNITFQLRGIDLTMNERYASGEGLVYSPAGMPSMGQQLRVGNFSDLNVYFRRSSNPWNPREGGRVLSTDWAEVSKDVRKDGVEISLWALPGRAPSGRMQGLGKTLTHEVGHWLGLEHTWNMDSCDSDADGIDDTPIHLGPSLTCSAPLNTCPSQPGDDPSHNFMNYVDERCYNSFTTGQVNHMRDRYQRRIHTPTREYIREDLRLPWFDPQLNEFCLGSKNWCSRGLDKVGNSEAECLAWRKSPSIDQHQDPRNQTTIESNGNVTKIARDFPPTNFKFRLPWFHPQRSEGCMGTEAWCKSEGSKVLGEKYCLEARNKQAST